MVPHGGKISYADIAAQTGLGEQMVRRLLRSAISMRIFQEPEQNMISHTKASKMLVDPIANDWLRAGTEEMWPANVKVGDYLNGLISVDSLQHSSHANSRRWQMIDALQKWPHSTEPNETV